MSRITANRALWERFTNRDSVVIRNNGNALSPMRGSSPLTSTTTPTWFVGDPDEHEIAHLQLGGDDTEGHCRWKRHRAGRRDRAKGSRERKFGSNVHVSLQFRRLRDGQRAAEQGTVSEHGQATRLTVALVDTEVAGSVALSLLRDLPQVQTQRLATIAVGRSPGLERQREELLLRGRDTVRDPFLVEPADRLAAMALDLPGQHVADGSRGLDLAPHARRDLYPSRERLLEALGREAGRQRLLRVRLEQRDRVLSSRDGEVGHGNVN